MYSILKYFYCLNQTGLVALVSRLCFICLFRTDTFTSESSYFSCSVERKYEVFYFVCVVCVARIMSQSVRRCQCLAAGLVVQLPSREEK